MPSGLREFEKETRSQCLTSIVTTDLAAGFALPSFFPRLEHVEERTTLRNHQWMWMWRNASVYHMYEGGLFVRAALWPAIHTSMASSRE